MLDCVSVAQGGTGCLRRGPGPDARDALQPGERRRGCHRPDGFQPGCPCGRTTDGIGPPLLEPRRMELVVCEGGQSIRGRLESEPCRTGSRLTEPEHDASIGTGGLLARDLLLADGRHQRFEDPVGATEPETGQPTHELVQRTRWRHQAGWVILGTQRPRQHLDGAGSSRSPGTCPDPAVDGFDEHRDWAIRRAGRAPDA